MNAYVFPVCAASHHARSPKENTAARLLTRPGEAIYNDANGLIEGNHPFQIAWLPDEERTGYLAVIQHFAHERGITPPPPVVFEGNIPSDVSRNGELMALIASYGDVRRPSSVVRCPLPMVEDRSESSTAPLQRTTDHGPRTPHIWLGEAVEIGPPTSITFAPQTGCNLLLVGSDISAATGILTTALIAIAAQDPHYRESKSPRATPRGSDDPDDAQLDDPAPPFYVFDGSPAGSPEAQLWSQLADIVPGVQLVTPQIVPQALDELTAERHRREAQQSLGAGLPTPPLFVIIAGVSKFRDLRKSEDDFTLSGFGSASEDGPPDPGKQFTDLLAGGPEVGMHTLLWSDSYSNVDRWLSRGSLREFELRIAFPMNAADSSNLIDTPAASRLGVHRALLYREETGTSVKFRPYGPPTQDWLHWLHTQLTPHHALEPATNLEGFHVT